MNTDVAPVILIVEDERIVAMDLQQTLCGMGYDAFAIASSADEAIKLASERRPSLVLMDIRIKGERDGIETAEILKDRFNVPLVYLTAHADEGMIERAKKTEPYGYLLKPVKPDELRSTIEIVFYRLAMEDARKIAWDLELEKRALEESSRLKDELFANMTHELRTPLNAIVGFAQLMRDGAGGAMTEDQEEFLNEILAAGRRLLNMLTDALDLANIEAGKFDLHPESVDLPKAVQDTIEMLRQPLEEKAHRLKVRIDPVCARVVNDPTMLKHILRGYLSNAIKFTPQGGNVTISAAPEEPGFFRIEVVDTGIGIEADSVRRLFVAFQQLERGSAKNFEGAGLSLALVKRISEAQGGRVGVESVPGKGSTFFAVLPLTLDVQARSPSQSGSLVST